MADLLTLAQVKVALDIPVADTTSDARLQQALSNASAAIRTHCGRNFAAGNVTETRSYSHDRSGWLEIDDASVITAVTLDGVLLTVGYDYVAGPDRGILTPDGGTIYEWLELRPGLGQSPEMGFERNLDTLYRYGTTKRYSTVAVTATYGWPDVPADVEQAAILTTVEFANDLMPFSSASIGNYSYTEGSASSQAIPPKAKELLFNYRRFA